MNRLNLLLLSLLILVSCKEQKKPYLSNLQATADSPLYTTYAAAMERSEFALDEGYEMMFYNKDRGIEFTTDTGGDISTGFFINGKWIFAVKDMFKAPTISLSYPDMVKYTYYPVDGLRVDVSFLVQSSYTALYDIKLHNETKTTIDVKVVPFIQNNYHSFDQVQYFSEGSYFTFNHTEFADGWTRTHDIPYVEQLKNIWMMSEADEKGIFNSIKGEAPIPPFAVARDKEKIFRINGRSNFEDGGRNTALAPQTRIQIYLNKNQNKLITENSPVWGENQAVIPNGGYFTNELGILGDLKKGDEYTLRVFTETNNTAGEYSHKLLDFEKGKAIRKDVTLTTYDGPYIPENIEISKDGTDITLKWKAGEGVKSYLIYRRNYENGYYERISETKENNYIDKNVNEGIYGYIVSSTDEKGRISLHSREVSSMPKVSFADYTLHGNTLSVQSDGLPTDYVRLISFSKQIYLEPGMDKSLRLIRTVERAEKDITPAINTSKQLLTENLDKYIEYNETLFSKVPEVNFESPDKEMLYWSAFNMMRQVFLPAEAKSKYNYYVFSREPTWGWGHGGQVFHESISMLAYALLDGESAMNSQRVYEQRQYENGYINYRTGSYLDEIIEHDGELTSSAPWYAWQNWEVYKITKDKVFLKDMYNSSKRFYNFYVKNRDKDGDGLCEWNGHAILESVRDALVAVWDEVGWPSNFEGVDVNSMLVMEAKSLENMAKELGLTEEAEGWKKDWTTRADLINKTFWDEETGFYYNTDLKNNSFTFKNANDLKRKEIIGFLPMWAGIVPPDRLEKLTAHLFNPNEFWRKYGVPTLSADDPYYNAKGYWNGPVWVEWDLFIMQGLLEYGYKKEAKELVERVAENMILQLKKDHNLWEFYSPDEQWAGYHKTYIWAGIINRMLMDAN